MQKRKVKEKLDVELEEDIISSYLEEEDLTLITAKPKSFYEVLLSMDSE